jgi:acetolactate synthase-1/2/3 large subunit
VEGTKKLVRRLGLPVLTSWGAKDLIAHDDPLLVGTFGSHGTRAGNFTVQNADLVLAIGARLSTRETGTPLTDWARGARTIVVDIDPAELGKFTAFGRPLDLAICADANAFVETLNAHLVNAYKRPPISPWLARIREWQLRYPIGEGDRKEAAAVKPYAFVHALAAALPDDEHLFVDTGCSIAWIMQAFSVRGSQRIYHDFNNTAMGWALPASIAGVLALCGRPVTCITGDGSLMMNVQELATIKRHRVPVRIFVMNNGGYSMVQQTQEQWLGGEYFGTSLEGGLAFPDFGSLAQAFSIPYQILNEATEVNSVLDKAVKARGPMLVDVRLARTERVIPQAKFGYPIEDAEPLLPRSEFLSNMIVPPVPKSLEPLP